MPLPDPSPRAGLLDLFLGATQGAFPGQMLEALIARLEAGK
jgi:hypothetical protein